MTTSYSRYGRHRYGTIRYSEHAPADYALTGERLTLQVAGAH
jgi:hypothetical protein